MADDVAIRVHNLSKFNRIYDALRDRLKQFVGPKPSFVCTTCGEAWMDNPVAVKLEGFFAGTTQGSTRQTMTPQR